MKTYDERVEAARALGDAMIEREIARCRAQMGELKWREHGEWVTSNIVAAAKTWLSVQLKEGRL